MVLARGFEVEVARALARRLRLRLRLVQVGDTGRLTRPGAKPWDAALAQLVSTPANAREASRSRAPICATILWFCSAAVFPDRLRSPACDRCSCVPCAGAGPRTRSPPNPPPVRPQLVGDVDTLLRRVQTGACDAAVAEALQPRAGLEGRRDLFGGLAGRIETNRAYAVVLERGSPLLPPVEAQLRRLRVDGTLRRLTREWLGIDPARLRVLG